MSLEEAQHNLRQAYANLHGLSLSRYEGVIEDLTKARGAATEAEDRLILEGRAEMPCYLWGCEGPQTREPAGHLLWGCARYDLEGMCPSCKAREALKEQVHA